MKTAAKIRKIFGKQGYWELLPPHFVDRFITVIYVIYLLICLFLPVENRSI